MNTNQNKPGRAGDGEMRNQLEVLRLMEQYRSDAAGEEIPSAPPAEPVLPAESEPVAEESIHAPVEDPEPPAQDPKPRKKRTLRETLLGILYAVIPVAGDPPQEILRKVIFVVALLTLIGSSGYIINDMVIQPAVEAEKNDILNSYYDPNTAPPLTEEEEAFEYPEGMDESFKKLYYINQDLFGWFTYKATNSTTWIDLSYPVVLGEDNDFYLDHDFYKANSKNGALFVDYRCSADPDAINKNVIIYGHNMGSGQMFSRLNYLITNNLYNIRSAATFQFNTLYEQSTYKVFAVMITNTEPEHGPIFDYIRTSFSSDEDFLQFVAECRERSIYDFADVKVEADDELVMLSTCSPSSKTHFKEGRTVVVARKVREGEDPTVNTSKITENKDCIYPLEWYKAQDLEPHPYYEGNYVITPSGGQTLSPIISDSTTTATDTDVTSSSDEEETSSTEEDPSTDEGGDDTTTEKPEPDEPSETTTTTKDGTATTTKPPASKDEGTTTKPSSAGTTTKPSSTTVDKTTNATKPSSTTADKTTNATKPSSTTADKTTTATESPATEATTTTSTEAPATEAMTTTSTEAPTTEEATTTSEESTATTDDTTAESADPEETESSAEDEDSEE